METLKGLETIKQILDHLEEEAYVIHEDDCDSHRGQGGCQYDCDCKGSLIPSILKNLIEQTNTQQADRIKELESRLTEARKHILSGRIMGKDEAELAEKISELLAGNEAEKGDG